MAAIVETTRAARSNTGGKAAKDKRAGSNALL
jgi:hypothetical protein